MRQNNMTTSIAYILKGFPRLSETFIANEIYLLETMGLKLKLFSVKEGERQQHDVIKKIQAPLNYCPNTTSLSGTDLLTWFSENWPNYRQANHRLFKRRPLAYLLTLMHVFWMTIVYRKSLFARPKKVFIKEFLQAVYIAEQLLDMKDVGHLHGHFCHGATTITWFISKLTGLSYSFTAHAKDIYQKQLNPGNLLNKKIKSSQFVATCTGANHSHLCDMSPKSERIHTIYHGLDTDFFRPDTTRRQTNPPLILSVGRFVEKKGFDVLIEACALLHAEGFHFICRIIGPPDEASGKVEALIIKHGLEQVVQLLDPVTQADLREQYLASTVFCLPCRIIADGDRDGIPNVMVEAMASGLPCVSTRISGIPELIKNNHNGLLVSPDQAAELFKALRKLLLDETVRSTMCSAARQTVLNDFDSNQTTADLKQLFQQCLLFHG
jgi:glycosyltransferase involved in cell wall biosynthesis